ncbi:ABC transporter substrate-binding protein [Vogesella sp. LIG4]|uniref:ABC transporter substrate-binding protein n=1 Tax=Vogesella sp. LIG4 TaxID=1192162 RepID=UPI00081F8847|nr:ABC transporter substrate-binding protein [Vogesella sp. LIG4]SCK23372.1 NitT/TauT family transport system substrate-binding protein [Vogesella sp. LIG4]
MPPPPSPYLSRRDCLHAVLLAVLSGAVAACRPPVPLLRVGSNGWPGYLMLELAAQSGLYAPEQIRVIRFPSSTLVMQGLSSGALEAACLTLDEVLSMRAEGVPLQVAAVLDISAGADMLLVRDGIATLAQLAGKRIGVEQSAVGAVMLDAVLQQAHLQPADITLVPLLANRHEQAFLSGELDAVVTFEPHASRLMAAGAKLLFSSMAIPGRILNVLAVRSDVVDEQHRHLQLLLDGHFRMLTGFIQQERGVLSGLATLLATDGQAVKSLYWGLRMPDRQENQDWITGQSPLLLPAARQLQQVMQAAGLLRSNASLDQLLLPLSGGAS